MGKKNITLQVDEDMYLNFKAECVRNKIAFGHQLEKFMQGYSQNQKISDFLTFEEATNPRLDIVIEDMEFCISKMDSKRALELFYKCQEWLTRLQKA